MTKIEKLRDAARDGDAHKVESAYMDLLKEVVPGPLKLDGLIAVLDELLDRSEKRSPEQSKALTHKLAYGCLSLLTWGIAGQDLTYPDVPVDSRYFEGMAYVSRVRRSEPHRREALRLLKEHGPDREEEARVLILKGADFAFPSAFPAEAAIGILQSACETVDGDGLPTVSQLTRTISAYTALAAFSHRPYEWGGR